MTGWAIVTGGAGGIGAAILRRLGADGFRTASWDVEPGAADFVATVDVLDRAALDRAATALDGPIRALVVNAGVLGPVAPSWEVPEAELRRVLDVNLVGAFLTLGAVVPRMLGNARPVRGRVVLMASVQGKEGTALSGAYAASKAGLIALAKVAGKELAPQGVLVNAVTPTVVRGEMERSLTEARRADLLARIPMGRFIEPDEVAALVAWLCGQDCTASTGAVFDLSGGRST